MALRRYFATPLYTARLQRSSSWRAFNARLQRECLQLREDDAAGRRWSRGSYPGGFTSYASAHHMHLQSPVFARLQRLLDPHVLRLARALDFELRGRPLAMTDCWVNIMRRQVVHGLHLHPLATISGTYYVKAPAGSSGLKFEDPRLAQFMAAPPRRVAAGSANRAWITVPARAGDVVLFESWLRHEVPPNPGNAERVSVSFNYSWF